MSSSPSDKLIEVAKLFEGLYNQVESVLGPDLPSHSPIDHLAHIPPLILPIPEPHSLISKLSAAGASSALASDVSSIHAARAQDLASQYLDVYNKTCHEISRAYQPPFYERATSLFLRLQKIRALYDASLRRWEVEYVDLVKKRIGNRLPPKESFNRDFTPYLELYFKKNMFPSPADRRSLAKMSGMSDNQISTWFQNHRTRSKTALQDDHPRSKIPSCLKVNPQRSEIVINESLWDDEMTDVESGNEQGRTYSRSSSVTLVENDHPLNACFSPAYAFPNPYPPHESIYPFPAESDGFVFTKPIWARNPRAKFRSSPEPDIDALTSAFRKLKIGKMRTTSRPTSTRWGLYAPRKKAGYNVTSFYTLQLVPAPLPSLVIAISPRPPIPPPSRESQPPNRSSKCRKHRITRETIRHSPCPSAEIHASLKLNRNCKNSCAELRSQKAGKSKILLTDSAHSIHKITRSSEDIAPLNNKTTLFLRKQSPCAIRELRPPQSEPEPRPIAYDIAPQITLGSFPKPPSQDSCGMSDIDTLFPHSRFSVFDTLTFDQQLSGFAD